MTGAGVGLGRYLFGDDGFWGNFYSEALGILITVLVIEAFSRFRARDAWLREQILDAGSSSNDTAKSAIDRLRREDALFGDDSVLRNANLVGANLEGANLEGVNLSGANLTNANLQQANLKSCNLSAATLAGARLSHAQLPFAIFSDCDMHGAHLENAKCRFAKFDRAILQDAHFYQANLKDAQFKESDLSSANLTGADIEFATFSGVVCGSQTRLPDGSLCQSPDDWTRFGARMQL
ncbi:MAG: pentapeptide repeat-containing protein [Chloroflexota bacterium]|nr:pentapeptide repeat-containing protein [Chloroflexota bacterium]